MELREDSGRNSVFLSGLWSYILFGLYPPEIHGLEVKIGSDSSLARLQLVKGESIWVGSDSVLASGFQME